MSADITTALRIVGSQPWAITTDYLRIIEEIAAGNSDPVALSTQLGRPLENTRTVEVRGGVAIIPVHSVIFRRASMLNEISGNAASVETIARDFMAALTDPSIKAILFDFDTPGGQVAGISELAHTIFNARGVKPIAGYVEDLCASAGFWIGAACPQLFVGRMAKVGSVGIIASATVGDTRNRKSVTSRYAVNKNVPIDTRRGEDLIQQEVDTAETMFIDDLALMRGVSVDKVISDFGKGGVVYAAEAISLGMADQISTFEEVLASLQQGGSDTGTDVGNKVMSAMTGKVHAALDSIQIKGKVELYD